MKQTILLIVAIALVGCKTTTENTLGMKFVSVLGTKVQFSIWETRVKDYAVYAAANAGVDRKWETRPPFKQADTHSGVYVNW